MDELRGSGGFQNQIPLMKKRRTTRRPRHDPNSPPDSDTHPHQTQTHSHTAGSGFRKREKFLLNSPPPTADEPKLATYRRASTKNKDTPPATINPAHTASPAPVPVRQNNKVTKFKVKVGGVSHTIHQNKGENSHTPEPTRKSIRMNKRRLLDDEDLTHYQKPAVDSENNKPKKKRVSKNLPSDDSTDYEAGEEEEPAVVAADVGSHTGREKVKNLTSRQRAMLNGGKDNAKVEFPEGLPPAPSRKLKNKVSEEEQQAKKAEAAQRRRFQVEKAARESQEDAIRKILGLDSDKKKEEKKLKEKEQKERRAESQKSNGSSVKWVMGPTGTVVSFPDDVGLPCIFNSKPCQYPPPREKCAGPACNNTYRYRDSKSKLPLCSLECYRAVQETA